MITFQDLVIANTSEKALMDFIYQTISSYKDSKTYKTAVIANEYDAQRNVTICEYQKLLYTISGKTVPDNFSANSSLFSSSPI